VAVDIGLTSPLRRWSFQGLWHIALWVAPGQVFAQLSDHAEAVGSGAGGKVRKALLVAISDLTGNARHLPFLLEQKAVEVSQQLGLTLVISA
jgi:hypothetical protein